jgi:hypothetical protein
VLLPSESSGECLGYEMIAGRIQNVLLIEMSPTLSCDYAATGEVAALQIAFARAGRPKSNRPTLLSLLMEPSTTLVGGSLRSRAGRLCITAPLVDAKIVSRLVSRAMRSCILDKPRDKPGRDSTRATH